jgi:hypothetical protein
MGVGPRKPGGQPTLRPQQRSGSSGRPTWILSKSGLYRWPMFRAKKRAQMTGRLPKMVYTERLHTIFGDAK